MSQAFPPLNPEYDAFLYTVIRNEKNGMYVTMASVIARSGVDPWSEAARISKLQKDTALSVLACLIGEHDGVDQKLGLNQMTLDQLLSLLPKPRPALAINVAESSIHVGGVPIKTGRVAIAASLCIFVFLAYFISGLLRPEPNGQMQKPRDLNLTETRQ
jgi:hypothetical protein